MNDADLLWVLTMRALVVFAVIFWLLVGIGVLLMTYGGEPGAVSMVIGCGIWAVNTSAGAIFWRATK